MPALSHSSASSNGKRRNDSPLFSFGGAIAILGVLALILVGLWSSAVLNMKTTSSQSFETVEQTLLARLDTTVYPKQDDLSLKRYFNLDPDGFTDVAIYRKSDALSPNEFVLVSFDSADAAQAFEDAMNKRRDDQVEIYTGYAPEAAAISKKALLDVQGNYAMYYVGDDPAGFDQAFLESLRG